jgi:hypothetical protein
MNVYHTGNEIGIEATLQLNGAALPVTALTVTARLVNRTRTGLAAGTAAVTCTKPGDVGKVKAVWLSTQTGSIVPGTYTVEFSTNDGPYTHEGVEIEIRQGVLL